MATGEPWEWGRLTPAEREVVRLALEGWTNRQVGARRGCAPHTVANELTSAYRKLGVGSRAELLARAAAGGRGSTPPLRRRSPGG